MAQIFQKIAAFFMAVFTFLSGLFGCGKSDLKENEYKYGPNERQVVQIVLPDDADKTCGVILFIHGGGWIAGDKNEYAGYLNAAAGRGYIGASLNYRYISDTVHAEDELDDIGAALNKKRHKRRIRDGVQDIFPFAVRSIQIQIGAVQKTVEHFLILHIEERSFPERIPAVDVHPVLMNHQMEGLRILQPMQDSPAPVVSHIRIGSGLQIQFDL